MTEEIDKKQKPEVSAYLTLILGVLVYVLSMAVLIVAKEAVDARDRSWEKCLREAPPGYTCVIPNPIKPEKKP